MKRVHALLLVAALPVTACSEGAGGAWDGSIADSAGVAVVHNPLQGMWPRDGGWRVEEELRIGTVEGDASYQFGEIPVGGIAVTSTGEVLVLDQHARTLRVFSADGRYLRTIGRPGGGHGELGQGLTHVLVAAGDTIYVPDMQHQRVTVYLPDATVVRSFRMSIEQGIPMMWNATHDALVGQLRPLAMPGMPEADSMDVIVRFRSDGSIADTLRAIPSGRTFSFAGGAPQFHFFSAEPMWTVGPDARLLFASNEQFRLSVYGRDGGLERVVTMPVEKRPVEQSDQTILIDAIERLWRDAGVPPQAMQQMRGAISFAEHFPAFMQFQPGPDGSVWVQRIQIPSAIPASQREAYNPMLDLGSSEWDVFDAEGRYLGVVRMPPRFQPVRFVGDHVYGVQRDDLDVQYVVRMRIVRDQA